MTCHEDFDKELILYKATLLSCCRLAIFVQCKTDVKGEEDVGIR